MEEFRSERYFIFSLTLEFCFIALYKILLHFAQHIQRKKNYKYLGGKLLPKNINMAWVRRSQNLYFAIREIYGKKSLLFCIKKIS
jgi:hypothetical protein